jgi:hypothetical protein
MGRLAVASAVLILNGGSVPAEQPVAIELVTPEDVAAR